MIGNGVFTNCSLLKSIILPASVITIGVKAFYLCNSIIIYGSALDKPTGWYYHWNPSSRPVVWGYKY